ncbi:hypothetical protein LEP1GSC082_4162 [Leptospira kirschneri str. H2]|nr:hypothetical protein LEP1GSC082_4162 [Leptospira kirschneri str. H2]EMK05978.1 hypothetical protein LEP1GSC166_2097 [Leptospira kirschneri]
MDQICEWNFHVLSSSSEFRSGKNTTQKELLSEIPYVASKI